MLDYSIIILVIFFSLLALSCIITNCLILYVIIARVTAHGVFKYYIFSMAITDILIGIIIIPTYIAIGLFQIPKTNQQEMLYIGADMHLALCSMYHIALMSFDRMMAIAQPLLHRLHMRSRKAALKLLIYPWLFAALITAVNIAAINENNRYITSSVTGIGIPFLSTMICYMVVLFTIRKRNKHFSQNNSSSHFINEVRILKMVLCVLGVYLVCWLPFAIVNGMILQIMSSLEHKRVMYLVYAAKFLQYFNSTCNPLIYALFYPDYRAAVKDMLKRHFCKKGTRVHHNEVHLYGMKTTAL